jgi:hypothetical protein
VQALPILGQPPSLAVLASIHGQRVPAGGDCLQAAATARQRSQLPTAHLLHCLACARSTRCRVEAAACAAAALHHGEALPPGCALHWCGIGAAAAGTTLPLRLWAQCGTHLHKRHRAARDISRHGRAVRSMQKARAIAIGEAAADFQTSQCHAGKQVLATQDPAAEMVS